MAEQRIIKGHTVEDARTVLVSFIRTKVNEAEEAAAVGFTEDFGGITWELTASRLPEGVSNPRGVIKVIQRQALVPPRDVFVLEAYLTFDVAGQTVWQLVQSIEPVEPATGGIRQSSNKALYHMIQTCLLRIDAEVEKLA